MSFMEALRSRAEMVKGWRLWAERIVEAVEEILPGAEVYAFGSAVEGTSTGGSDVDILVVSKSLPERALERASLKVRVEETAELPAYHPFELHLVTPVEAQAYLRRAGGNVEKLAPRNSVQP